MHVRYILSFFHVIILLIALSVKMLWVLLILEWSVWRAERSFKEQIIIYGVSKESAKRIGAVYRNVMKKSVRGIFRRSLGGSYEWKQYIGGDKP
ncbi:MAG: hypothetical protein QXH97_05430 [Candidatus Bathyarchaeia archaeon]